MRSLFQENRTLNVFALPPETNNSSAMGIMEDTRGIEPIRSAPGILETRANSQGLSELAARSTWQIIIYSLRVMVISAFLIGLSGLCVLHVHSRSTQRGDYLTHKDIGAKQAVDPDSAVMTSVTGPIISKKQEYFI